MRRFLLICVLCLELGAWGQTQLQTHGLLITLRDNQWVIQAVLPGSSAESAQLRPGDSIVAFRGAKGDRFFDINPQTMGAMASELDAPRPRPLGLRLQRGSKTWEVEVEPTTLTLTTEGLRGLPEGTVTASEHGSAQISFSRDSLAYGDKVALVQGREILGIGEVRDGSGSNYRISTVGLRRTASPTMHGPGDLPQGSRDSDQGLKGARVVLLAHSSHYYENASAGHTASGRVDRPYVKRSAALEPFERQVSQGSLKTQSATVRGLDPTSKTFQLIWQSGSTGPVSISGSQARQPVVFSSRDPVYELNLLYKGAPVWYSADVADQGKDASHELRDGQAVKVYYRPYGTEGSSSKEGRKIFTRQGEAVLIILDQVP